MSFFSGLKNYFYNRGAYSSNYRDESFDTKSWQPPRISSDSAILSGAEEVKYRVSDLVRNDGFMKGALQKLSDAAIGSNGLTLNAEVDNLTLSISEDEAESLNDFIERHWSTYTTASENFVDSTRRHGYASFLSQAFKTFAISGGILATIQYDTSSPYPASLQLIDPQRLSNPSCVQSNENVVRGGIEYDRRGRVVAYWIKPAELEKDSKITRTRGSQEAQRINAFDNQGRKRVIHCFDPDYAENGRGVSLFAAGVDASKRGHDLARAVMKQAISQSLIAMVIHSDLKSEEAFKTIGNLDNLSYDQLVASHLQLKEGYYQNNRIQMGDLKAIHLLPNETLKMENAGGVSGEYAEFAKAHRQESAAASGLTYEMFSNDYAGLSFSGGQLSLDASWRGIEGIRNRVLTPFLKYLYTAFLETLFINHPEALPDNVSFETHKHALCKASFFGPPKPSADARKEADAAKARLEAGVSTYAQEAIRFGHADWRQLKRQQALEKAFDEELGLPDFRVFRQDSLDVVNEVVADQ